MGDHHGGAAATDHFQGIDHLMFRAVIQGTGGLIEHKKTGITEKSPGQCQPLALATGKLMAIFTHLGKQTKGQISHIFL